MGRLDRENAVTLGNTPDPFTVDMWDEDLWDDLLAYIEAGAVVPIIGPSCYPVEVDGRTRSLEIHVAERFAEKLELPVPATLNEVVLSYLRAGGERRRLYRTVHDIVQEAQFAPPPMLKQLAEIRQFNLFVTTGFDSLLETALNEARFGGVSRTRSIAYAPNNKQDLPAGAEDAPIVYHLFGKTSPLPNSFAVSDEDLLEFLMALQSDTRRPENLLTRLKSEHVLLVGAHFPDWVARMFLRTTKGRRLSESRDELEFLAEESASHEPSLVTFLKHFSPPTRLFAGDLGRFVEILWQRWRERHAFEAAAGQSQWTPLPAETPVDGIFISYAREDLPAVRVLARTIEKAGLSVWFDVNRLNAGDSFDLKIQQNIRRCSLFIPVLSRNTPPRAQGFFRREWHYALDRDIEIDPSQPFIVPVAIDEAVDIGTLPRRFREINITQAPGGWPSDEFVAQLKAIYR
jgi:hypothetical protein